MTGTRTPSRRLASPTVAWLLASLIVVLLAGYTVLAAATHELTSGSDFWANVLIIVPVTAIGLLVATRQPSNPTGWIALAEAVLCSLGSVGGQYAVTWTQHRRWRTRSSSGPHPEEQAWRRRTSDMYAQRLLAPGRLLLGFTVVTNCGVAGPMSCSIWLD
jgi:hypothetical protein